MNRILVVYLAAAAIAGPLLSAEKAPLELPMGFNPDTGMISHTVDGVVFHQPRASVWFAESLLANGTAQDVALADRMLRGVLTGQIRDPEHPHYGAYKWELEMEEVEDLNAVEFLLYSLVSIAHLHGDVLADDLLADLKQSIGLGLENIKRVDVSLQYTNIALKDITNTILGGEMLGDEALAHRGYDKFHRWLEYTNQSGHPYEYNSNPYTAVAIDVLRRLSTRAQSIEIQVRAKVALQRLGLSAGLHMHEPTGRWAGPHSRAYHPAVIGSGGNRRLEERERNSFAAWVDSGKLPAWMDTLIDEEVFPETVFETTSRSEGIGISTYKTDAYSLGIATRNLSNQNNRFIAWQGNSFALHYKRSAPEKTGAVYTRYLLNDHWLGYFSAGTGRGGSYLLPDEGSYQGIQDGERSISLYAPETLGADRHFSSAKSVVAIPRWNKETDAVWVDGRRIDTFPTEFEAGETTVFETGEIMLAVKPFTLTQLGKTMPARLVEREDTLVLELYNYQGALKTFWELAWPGAFYQGRPQNGFYSEVAKRSDYESAVAFADLVDSGEMVDVADPRRTYTGTEERKWKVGYEREGRSLALEVDLFDWSRPAGRWVNGEPVGFPALLSERAVQSKSGRIEVGDVVLEVAPGQDATLYRSSSGTTVVALYQGPLASPLTLSMPQGSVRLESLKAGVVVWSEEGVTVDALGLQGLPQVQGNKLLENE